MEDLKQPYSDELKARVVAMRQKHGLDPAYDTSLRLLESMLQKEEDEINAIPPESIPSDAPSEYMRGYSDGLAQAEETIAAAIQRAKAEEREACEKLCIAISAEWMCVAAQCGGDDACEVSRANGAQECADEIRARQ